MDDDDLLAGELAAFEELPATGAPLLSRGRPHPRVSTIRRPGAGCALPCYDGPRGRVLALESVATCAACATWAAAIARERGWILVDLRTPARPDRDRRAP